MRDYMMTVDMYNMICGMADYVGIEVRTYAEVVDVLTITLMYGDVMEEKFEITVQYTFKRKYVDLDQTWSSWQSDR